MKGNVSSGSGRLHGLDALRAGALGLGIVIHSLMPFLPGDSWESSWLVNDSQNSDTAAVAITVIHLFRMVTFMMLAGYFGRMVLHRRGPKSYVKDRGLRILLPLLVFGPLVLVSTGAVVGLDQTVRGTEAPPLDDAGVPLWMLLTNPGHLWFLNVLMQCVVITVLVRAALVRLVGRERLASWARNAGLLIALPGGFFVAAVPYLASLLIQGNADGGIEPPLTILPETAPLVGYLGAFLVGWCLHARADALARIAGLWPYHLSAAIVLTVVGHFTGATALSLPGYAVVTALAGWAWTLGLLGMCVRLLRRENPVVRYLADSSYWVFVLHLPVLAAVQVFFADLAWPVIVKLLIAWSITGVLLLLSYDVAVRGTWLGKWLNGRRHPPVLRRHTGPAE